MDDYSCQQSVFFFFFKKKLCLGRGKFDFQSCPFNNQIHICQENITKYTKKQENMVFSQEHNRNYSEEAQEMHFLEKILNQLSYLYLQNTNIKHRKRAKENQDNNVKRIENISNNNGIIKKGTNKFES